MYFCEGRGKKSGETCGDSYRFCVEEAHITSVNTALTRVTPRPSLMPVVQRKVQVCPVCHFHLSLKCLLHPFPTASVQGNLQKLYHWAPMSSGILEGGRKVRWWLVPGHLPMMSPPACCIPQHCSSPSFCIEFSPSRFCPTTQSHPFTFWLVTAPPHVDPKFLDY